MKKWMNRIFSIVFILLLLLPMVTMDLRTNQISEIDNTYLPEITWQLNGSLLTNIENYINARIGFRTEALDLYQRLNADLFGIMEHPKYMYGKDGHVFFRVDDYIEDYQHLNLDEDWAEEFAQSMQTLSDTANRHGAEFIYMLIPDKKTVYAEYFPDSVNVKGEVSRTDQVLEALKKTDVDWIYVKDTMVENKQTMQVCNVLYDAGHWNENGAFVSYQQLYQRIRNYFPEVEPLEKDDFTVETVLMESLLVSRFQIHEQVPNYVRKQTNAIREDAWEEKGLFFTGGTEHYERHVNPEQPDKPKLLVFHDSYMIDHEKFFTENFSEVVFLHRDNVVNFEVYERYLELLQPDLVIYENPERVFPITFDGEYRLPD